MKNKIWLSSPHMGGGEQKYVKEAFDTNWVAPLGPNVNGFENDLETYLAEDTHIAALSSGTAALHLALIILGVGPGDEVICQTFTFSATANPIAYLGAMPVFVDSEKDTWNLSPVLLEEAINDRIAKGKKPKAIIPVHLYGMPANMGEINCIAAKYGIPVLEDAAEALGSHIDGKNCGTFGTMACLSFNGNKIITTSGGGALVANDLAHKKRSIFLATQSKDDELHYQHSHIGYNYRMSNIVAGIGRGQMEVLDAHLAVRRRNFDYYQQKFSAISWITFLAEPTGYFCNRWLSCILVQPHNGITKDTLRLALENENIESRHLWKPLHLQPVFAASPAYTDGTAEYLFNHGLCLPSGSNLSLDDLDRVVAVVTDIYQGIGELEQLVAL